MPLERYYCSIIISSQTISCSISFNTCASCTHSLHQLTVQRSRAALSIQVPDPWPKQCPYMDRNERSVIATLVNTKLAFIC